MQRELNALKSLIGRLAFDFEKENEAAFALWSWLPSHAVAKKHHGDYACEFCPAIRDLLVEAALLFSSTKYGIAPERKEEFRQWFEECPCGEPHEP